MSINSSIILPSFYRSVGQTLTAFILAVVLSAALPAFAQWSANPESNRKLVEDTPDPVNLSVVNDEGKGFYLMWQDKTDNTGDIYFQHLNYDGNASIHGSGIKINGAKAALDAQAIMGINGTLLVFWKEIISENHQTLKLQRLKRNGFKFWTGSGITINEHVEMITSFAGSSDTAGVTTIAFIEKTLIPKTVYRLKLQRITLNGYSEYSEDGISVLNSSLPITDLQIIQAPEGGVILFWLESKNKNNVLNARYIDKRGRMRWSKTGSELFGSNFNIFNYKASLFPGKGFHLTWTSITSKSSVYHQLYDFNGKNIWTGNFKSISETGANLSGMQTCITTDNGLVLGWVTEVKNKRSIKINKYNLNGIQAWQEPRTPHIPDTVSNNFGISLIPDERGGVIASWFTKNAKQPRAAVYAQRLGLRSELLWGENGIAIARNPKTEKSYLHILPDGYNGIVAVFKESESNKHGIFGQRIFSNKSYNSQISDFKAEYNNDTISMSWAVSNESGVLGYRVERTILKEKDEESVWQEAGNIQPKNLSVTGRYTFRDTPNEQGTYIYRIIQIGGFGDLNVSNTARVDYFPERSDRIYVIPGQQLVFSDSSVISFNLPEPVEVSIELFNSKLEKVEQFELTETIAGMNRFVFFSRKYPQGVYYYRFKAGEFMDVKKLVISRSGWR